MFISIERRTADPLVPLELFRSRILTTGAALAVLGGAARASTFVLVALYLQQVLTMAPQQAGLAMVPTSLTGFAFSLALLPRIVRSLGPQRTLVAGSSSLPLVTCGSPTPRQRTATSSPSSPGSCSSPSASPSASPPRPWSSRPPCPTSHTGLASGLAGSATQVGAALGTAAFTAIGISVSGPLGDTLGASGFSAAFTAAAAVALATAALGATLARPRS